MTALVDLDTVENHTLATRALHKKWSAAKPFVRVWANDPEGTKGLVLRGKVSGSTSGRFGKKKNEADTYTLKLRLDHYIAKWLVSIPNDPDAKKNVVITVDHMGLRFSGLLHHWTSKKDSDGIRYLEVTWISDEQFFLDFMLGPPNPALPIPVFQFPRVLPIFGPTRWAVSFLILINLMRLQGNWWTLPDDPFDWDSWTSSFDMSTWQCLIKMDSLLEDSSLWTLLATRMDKIGTVVEDAMDDAQCVFRVRRILTVDGETPADYGITYVDSCRNGALMIEVVDAAGYYSALGNVFGGALATGFARSVVTFAEGFIETYLTTDESEVIYPDEYYQPNYWLQKPAYPWIRIRDSKWSQVESSELTWNPATATSVIVGGSNPYADQAATLIIQSVGNILGYMLLGGFSSAGDIAAEVIMPFLQGTILAWLQWEHMTRAQQLGWVHLWEIKAEGGDSNAWSLKAIAALRAGFEATKSETTHTFSLTGCGPIYPGLHFDIGDRLSSTEEWTVPGVIFTNQVESIELAWDYTSDGSPHQYSITVGKNEAGMSVAERMSRLLTKGLDTLSNIGVHLIS